MALIADQRVQEEVFDSGEASIHTSQSISESQHVTTNETPETNVEPSPATVKYKLSGKRITIRTKEDVQAIRTHTDTNFLLYPIQVAYHKGTYWYRKRDPVEWGEFLAPLPDDIVAKMESFKFEIDLGGYPNTQINIYLK